MNTGLTDKLAGANVVDIGARTDKVAEGAPETGSTVATSTGTSVTTTTTTAAAKVAATSANPAGLPEDVLRQLRGASAEADDGEIKPILYVNPLTSAVVMEADYLAGAGKGLVNLVIIGEDGFIYNRKTFSCGRQITTKLGQAFVKKPAKVSKIAEGVQFLAFGNPVPRILLDQIIAFFRKVMKDKIKTVSGVGAGTHGSYEAMAHILWNHTTQSYRVAIPKQRVSQAAVSYDFDHIGADEEIIVDIHSHNNMGAFFSGTDNGDDRNMISVSGVAGKLSSPEHEMVWRFNIGGGQAMQIQSAKSVFAEDKPTIEVPDEWMDQVTTTYGNYGYGIGVHGGYAYPYAGAAARGGVMGAAAGTSRRHLSEYSDIDDFEDELVRRSPAAAAARTRNEERSGGAFNAARFPVDGTSVRAAKSKGPKRGRGRPTNASKQQQALGLGLGLGLDADASGNANGNVGEDEFDMNNLTLADFVNGKKHPDVASNGIRQARVVANNDEDGDFDQQAFEDLVSELMGDEDGYGAIGNSSPFTDSHGRRSPVTMLDDAEADEDDELGLGSVLDRPSYINRAFSANADTSSIVEHDDMGYGVDELCHIAMYAHDADIKSFIRIALTAHFTEPEDLDFLRTMGIFPIDNVVEDVQDIIETFVEDDATLAEMIAMVQEVEIVRD